MKATLNIRFDKETIEAAKRYADKHRTSLSKIIERYLRELVAKEKEKKFVSDDLIGIIEEYKEFSDEGIREKYLKGKHNA